MILIENSKQISNYYHLLIEFLPFIHELHKDRKTLKISFDTTNSLVLCKSVLRSIFKDNVIVEPYDASFVYSEKHDYNVIKKKLNKNFTDWMRESCISTKLNFSEKILIKRKQRYIQKDIIDFLVNEGFEETELENYSIEQQAKIINNAKIIIGSHGAGLTNLIFTNYDSIFLELSNGFNNFLFTNLANFMNYKNYNILFEQKIMNEIIDGKRFKIGDHFYDINKIESIVIKNKDFEMNLDEFKIWYGKLT